MIPYAPKRPRTAEEISRDSGRPIRGIGWPRIGGLGGVCRSSASNVPMSGDYRTSYLSSAVLGTCLWRCIVDLNVASTVYLGICGEACHKFGGDYDAYSTAEITIRTNRYIAEILEHAGRIPVGHIKWLFKMEQTALYF